MSIQLYTILYEMTTSVIFFLSYDLSKELFYRLKSGYNFNQNVLLSRTSLDVTFSRKSVNTRVVITLFMTRRYPLNYSGVI